MIVRDFVVADSQLHHLCGVSASPRWLKNSQTIIFHLKRSEHCSSGPFSYTSTALVVETIKLVLSFYCGVSNANCIVNIAITVNFEWVSLQVQGLNLLMPIVLMSGYIIAISVWDLGSWELVWSCLYSYLQPVHQPGGDKSDDWCLHDNWLVLRSQCFWVLSGHIQYPPCILRNQILVIAIIKTETRL